MKPLILFKTTIRLVRKPMSPVGAGFLILLLVVCLGLAPIAQAVGPDTDGTIPGSNNGEGIGVLVSRTTGVWNTGTGFEALNQLTAGNQNTATGLRALTSDTNGGFNTATGVYSLANNISGSDNTANGYAALYRNTASYDTAVGFGALYHNTTGTLNTANGFQALSNNTTGFSNTANGGGALLNNTTGNNNTALGVGAGASVTTASNVICIGAGGSNVSDSCFIGNIFNATASSGTAVLINSSGQLGTISSSRRFKKEIKPMDSASEAVLAFRPVTFHYKSDASGTPQFGLIAEEVAEVNPDLVVRDETGEIYTVRYDAVNAMLLNEFLKEHRKMQEQQKQIDALTAQLKQQAALIQKVSDKVEVNRSTRQVVANEQ